MLIGVICYMGSEGVYKQAKELGKYKSRARSKHCKLKVTYNSCSLTMTQALAKNLLVIHYFLLNSEFPVVD